MSDECIKTPDEMGTVLRLVIACVTPVVLVVYAGLLVPYLLWTACGAILTASTGRNWCLVFGELPVLKQEAAAGEGQAR